MHIKNPKYTVAAKTGTAQMVNPDTHKYYEDRYLHSFLDIFQLQNQNTLFFFIKFIQKM